MSVKDEKMFIQFLLSAVQFLMHLGGCQFKQLYVEFEHGSYTCSGDNAIVMKGVHYEKE